MCFWTDKLGFVESVATRPAYRRRGLASAIIQQMQADTSTPLMLDVETDDAERVCAARVRDGGRGAGVVLLVAGGLKG
ncbi:MAG: GNAT family N-acetyltransferase [Caldilineaceae bacterium]